MKNILSFSQKTLVLFLIAVAVSTNSVQAEGTVPSSAPTFAETIESLLAQVAVLQQALDTLMVTSAQSSNSQSTDSDSGSITFIPDGSTFGKASTITSIVVYPSNAGSADITLRSDKYETVVSGIIYDDGDDDEDYRFASTVNETPYTTFVSYQYGYSSGDDDEDEPEVTYGEPESRQKLLENLTRILDFDALLADNTMRFLIENPIYYRGRSYNSTDANECYTDEDKKMILEVIQFILDADKLKYNDLDEIVSFKVPFEETERSWSGVCYGTFDNTLEE